MDRSENNQWCYRSFIHRLHILSKSIFDFFVVLHYNTLLLPYKMLELSITNKGGNNKMLKVGERVRVIFAGNGVLKDTTKTESGIKIYIVELENGETVRTTEDRIDLYREGK